jgi:hypothetical protein
LIKIRLEVLIVIIVVVALAVVAEFPYVISLLQNPVVNPSIRSTYQNYGVSIQYPVGAKVHTNTPPNSTFGAIFWYWNHGNTELGIQWSNESFLPPNVLYPLVPPGNNATFLQSGNTTINGRTWHHVTYMFFYQRQLYQTDAVFSNQTEQRFYMITYYDQTNDTLAQLDYFGATFNG